MRGGLSGYSFGNNRCAARNRKFSFTFIHNYVQLSITYLWKIHLHRAYLCIVRETGRTRWEITQNEKERKKNISKWRRKKSRNLSRKMWLAEVTWWANDQHFPFENVIVINETSWESCKQRKREKVIFFLQVQNRLKNEAGKDFFPKIYWRNINGIWKRYLPESGLFMSSASCFFKSKLAVVSRSVDIRFEIILLDFHKNFCCELNERTVK